ncbi:MAG: GPR endopeptidase [Clostridia bacterium]|nr:GPR endopeptidase [Clostridia bacterium]
MNIRTDLVLETRNEHTKKISGVTESEKNIGNATLYTVKIFDKSASKNLQKPLGTYCTISFPRLDIVCDTNNIVNATVNALKIVCNSNINNTLVVGLGNTDITPDALGPFVADRVLATRHLSSTLKKDLGLDGLKSVCCLAPNVLGKTGIESYDLIVAAAQKIKPDVILAVDALACRDPERLCRTIQISDSGICPGAGVNNARKELSKNTVGIPVIAIGIPTVIDANHLFETRENMMVTPKEIDLLVEKASDILSRAINIFLQPELDIAIIESLT